MATGQFWPFFVRTLKRTTTFAILCRWMSLWSTRYMSTNNSTTSSKSMWCQMQLQCCILLSRKWFQHGIVSHRLDTKRNSVSCIRVHVKFLILDDLCLGLASKKWPTWIFMTFYHFTNWRNSWSSRRHTLMKIEYLESEEFFTSNGFF